MDGRFRVVEALGRSGVGRGGSSEDLITSSGRRGRTRGSDANRKDSRRDRIPVLTTD